MAVIKLEVEVDVRNELVLDVDTFALNFVSDLLNLGMKNTRRVKCYTVRLISPGEAARLEEWKVLIAVPWDKRTPEQQAKIDELALWFSSEERTIHIGAITQGEKEKAPPGRDYRSLFYQIRQGLIKLQGNTEEPGVGITYVQDALEDILRAGDRTPEEEKS